MWPGERGLSVGFGPNLRRRRARGGWELRPQARSAMVGGAGDPWLSARNNASTIEGSDRLGHVAPVGALRAFGPVRARCPRSQNIAPGAVPRVGEWSASNRLRADRQFNQTHTALTNPNQEFDETLFILHDTASPMPWREPAVAFAAIRAAKVHHLVHAHVRHFPAGTASCRMLAIAAASNAPFSRNPRKHH